MVRPPGVAAGSRNVLFTAVRNEAPFLLEWIAYHKAIGFERVVVFSNESDDGTDELLVALAQAGEIEHHPHVVPAGVAPQANAARIANESGLMRDGDWVLWLDADEFLVVNAGNGRLADLIAALGEHQGILVSWRLFGDGGNDRFPGRFVSGDFARASRRGFPGNMEVKALFRKSPGIRGFGEVGIHRPRLAADAGFGHHSFLAGNGRTLSTGCFRHERWLMGADHGSNRKIEREDHGYRIAQINHYSVRTPEHFALKRVRGRGWAADERGDDNQRHNTEFYQKMNRNDVDDRAILRFEDETTRGIEALRAHAAVRRADDMARERVAALVAALPPEAVNMPADPASPTRPTATFELTLPEQPAALLREHYSKAGCVLEYGSGGSTVLALQLGVDRIFSVESDRAWAERLQTAVRADFPDHHCVVHPVDIGPTGTWGRTTDSSGHQRYHRYAAEIWDSPGFVHPDVVLIDGRFRVACFLTTMLRCTRPVTVLFDDYGDRPEYHWVEEFFRPVQQEGRMALFDIKPTPFPSGQLTKIVGAFADQR